jgi:hypothetical protein
MSKGKRTSAQPVAAVDPLMAASDVARGLGHKPIRDHGDYGCWLCDLVGKVRRGSMTGEIFTERCR